MIQASTLRTSASGRYLTDLFHKRVRDLHRLTPGLKLTLRWTPGHEGIEGKERADEEAKLAAKGQTGPAAELTRELKRKLQATAFSLRRNFKAHLKTLATARWKASERGKRMADITEALLSSRTLSSPPPPAPAGMQGLSCNYEQDIYRCKVTWHGSEKCFWALVQPAGRPPRRYTTSS